MKRKKYLIGLVSSAICFILTQMVFAGDFDNYKSPNDPTISFSGNYPGGDYTFTESKCNYAQNKIAIRNASEYKIRITAEASGSSQSVDINPGQMGQMELKSNTPDGQVKVNVTLEMDDFKNPVKFDFPKNVHVMNQIWFTPEAASKKSSTVFYDVKVFLTSGIERSSTSMGSESFSFISKYGIRIEITSRDLANPK